MIQTQKINESYYSIDVQDKKILKEITGMLTLEKPKQFNPNSRFQLTEYEYFYRIHDGKLIVPIGLMPFLVKLGVAYTPAIPEYTPEEILEYIEECPIPFKPYEHQIKMVVDSLQIYRQICISCTGCVSPETIFDVYIE